MQEVRNAPPLRCHCLRHAVNPGRRVVMSREAVAWPRLKFLDAYKTEPTQKRSPAKVIDEALKGAKLQWSCWCSLLAVQWTRVAR